MMPTSRPACNHWQPTKVAFGHPVAGHAQRVVGHYRDRIRRHHVGDRDHRLSTFPYLSFSAKSRILESVVMARWKNTLPGAVKWRFT
jgi:hypothetical protein